MQVAQEFVRHQLTPSVSDLTLGDTSGSDLLWPCIIVDVHKQSDEERLVEKSLDAAICQSVGSLDISQ
ncbi:MAG: hypothetical protein ACPGYP_02500 [Solirubrobacterales bacterium]